MRKGSKICDKAGKLKDKSRGRRVMSVLMPSLNLMQHRYGFHYLFFLSAISLCGRNSFLSNPCLSNLYITVGINAGISF